MALKLRMSRGGRKALPYYRIVVTDSRSPRDSNFIERLGTYNPLLAQTDPNRVTLNAERIKHWLSQGAQPSERVAIFLGKAGIIPAPKFDARPKKSAPKAKAQERVKEQAAKAEAAREAAEAAKAAAAEAANAPAETAPEAAAE
jgi:small subunit ribosomal protein S16